MLLAVRIKAGDWCGRTLKYKALWCIGIHTIPQGRQLWWVGQVLVSASQGVQTPALLLSSCDISKLVNFSRMHLTVVKFMWDFKMGFRWPSGKESACQCRRCKRLGFNPWVRKMPWSRKWQPNPLQYSCLENSLDRGARLARDHGVTKSQIRLSNWTNMNYKTSCRR